MPGPLPDQLESEARTRVFVDGTKTGIRRGLDLIPGSSKVTVAGVDNATGEVVEVTIDVSPSALATVLAGDGLDASGDTLVVDETELDHGALGGLSDDDHPQYLTAAEMLGTPIPTFRSSAPSRFVMCYGQTLTNGENTHPDLWAVTPTEFRSGSNILIPDLRGRVPVGLDNMGGSDAGRLSASNTLGGSGGAETHTLTGAESGTAAHGHGVTDPGHIHTLRTDSSATGTAGLARRGSSSTGNTDSAILSNTTGITIDNASAANAANAHNNMQPYLLLNWMMLVLL